MRVLSQHEPDCVTGNGNEAATATTAVTQTIACITSTASALLTGNQVTGAAAASTCTAAVGTWSQILQGADPAVPTTPNLPPAPQLDFSPKFGNNDYDHCNCGSNCMCMG